MANTNGTHARPVPVIFASIVTLSASHTRLMNWLTPSERGGSNGRAEGRDSLMFRMFRIRRLADWVTLTKESIEVAYNGESKKFIGYELCDGFWSDGTAMRYHALRWLKWQKRKSTVQCRDCNQKFVHSCLRDDARQRGDSR